MSLKASIFTCPYSIGKNRYSQEAIDICSFIQPMLIDTFNSILLYNDMNALKHSFYCGKTSLSEQEHQRENMSHQAEMPSHA